MQSQSPETKKRADEFRVHIGFDQAGAREIPGRGVVAKWPSCAELLGLNQDAAWKGFWSKPRVVNSGLVSQDCLLKRRQEWILTEIAVSSLGATVARELLVDRANSTNMVDIPYESFPKGPGSLAIRSTGRGSHSYMWAYYNVFVQIRSDESSIDLLSIAWKVQRHLEQHLVDGFVDRVPRFDRLLVSPGLVGVGATARIDAVLAPPIPPDTSVDLEASWELLTIEETAERSWVVKATAPGRAQLRVDAVDRATLLSASREATLEISK